MSRRTIAGRGVIISFLLLQIIPLLLFPPESFSTSSQEWWLPLLLAFMVVLGDVQVLRRGTQLWPWHLFSFSHGFNIISRLMMLWPHATHIVKGEMVFNTTYVLLACVSMGFSGFLLWYLELPDVRLGLVR
ncbi:MAG: hypothetical protein ABSD88_02770 [Candidatus Korobacteraceae bacterium]|jgi:hypothetical protein